MARSLKTSADTEKKIQHLLSRLSLNSKNEVIKIAISFSIKQNTNVIEKYAESIKDNSGSEYHRNTLFSTEDEWIYNILLTYGENRQINSDRIFPDLAKAHIINGIDILYKLDTEKLSVEDNLKEFLIKNYNVIS